MTTTRGVDVVDKSLSGHVIDARKRLLRRFAPPQSLLCPP